MSDFERFHFTNDEEDMICTFNRDSGRSTEVTELPVFDDPHPSHKALRFSWDASTYDHICDDCGATDKTPGGWGDLLKPCGSVS